VHQVQAIAETTRIGQEAQPGGFVNHVVVALDARRLRVWDEGLDDDDLGLRVGVEEIARSSTLEAADLQEESGGAAGTDREQEAIDQAVVEPISREATRWRCL
jgi:hypothetical protein